MKASVVLTVVCMATRFLWVQAATPGLSEDELQDRRAFRPGSFTELMASIGGSQILECAFDYPGGAWVDHIVTWRKEGFEVPVYIQFKGYPPHVEPWYKGRLRRVDQASIEIRDIRPEDEGWYSCFVVFLDEEDSNSNKTWIQLSVKSPEDNITTATGHTYPTYPPWLKVTGNCSTATNTGVNLGVNCRYFAVIVVLLITRVALRRTTRGTS